MRWRRRRRSGVGIGTGSDGSRLHAAGRKRTGVAGIAFPASAGLNAVPFVFHSPILEPDFHLRVKSESMITYARSFFFFY